MTLCQPEGAAQCGGAAGPAKGGGDARSGGDGVVAGLSRLCARHAAGELSDTSFAEEKAALLSAHRRARSVSPKRPSPTHDRAATRAADPQPVWQPGGGAAHPPPAAACVSDTPPARAVPPPIIHASSPQQHPVELRELFALRDQGLLCDAELAAAQHLLLQQRRRQHAALLPTSSGSTLGPAGRRGSA